MTKRLLHIGVCPEEVGKYVLIPGSVERAALIAEYFDEPHLAARSREFLTYTGRLAGVPVSVTSTGIGGPSMALAVEELAACGAHTFIRVGSCASASPESRTGDVIIPRGAVRMEGTGEYYLPPEFPAVPDYDVFCHVEAAARRSGYRYNTGVTITKDSFYTEASPETKPVGEQLKFLWSAYEKGGASNTSMECAPLFLMGAALGLRTASVMICATNYRAYSNDDKDYPRGWERRAIEVAVDGLRSLILDDLAAAVRKEAPHAGR